MKSCTKLITLLLSSAASVVLLSSCVTTPEKKFEYNYGDEEKKVSDQPWVRPESFEGNPMGNMPQSR